MGRPETRYKLVRGSVADEFGGPWAGDTERNAELAVDSLKLRDGCRAGIFGGAANDDEPFAFDPEAAPAPKLDVRGTGGASYSPL